MNSKAAPGASAKCRIFEADDHPIARQGIALLVNREADMMVCGEGEQAHSALRAIENERPDLLIVDISLNGPVAIEYQDHSRAEL